MGKWGKKNPRTVKHILYSEKFPHLYFWECKWTQFGRPPPPMAQLTTSSSNRNKDRFRTRHSSHKDAGQRTMRTEHRAVRWFPCTVPGRQPPSRLEGPPPTRGQGFGPSAPSWAPGAAPADGAGARTLWSSEEPGFTSLWFGERHAGAFG